MVDYLEPLERCLVVDEGYALQDPRLVVLNEGEALPVASCYPVGSFWKPCPL